MHKNNDMTFQTVTTMNVFGASCCNVTLSR